MSTLMTGHLPRTGAAFALSLLGESDLDEIGNLHDRVIASLGPYEKTFLLPRTAAYFAAHVRRGDGSAVLGIRSEDKLVAKALLLHPAAHETTPEQLGGAILISPPQDTSIMQAASVHPDWRGNGLMGIMVRQWLTHAQAWQRNHVLAEVEIHNQASWSLFLKEGMEIVRVGKSPIDGADVYNVREGYGTVLALTDAAPPASEAAPPSGVLNSTSLSSAPPPRERVKYAMTKSLTGMPAAERAGDQIVRCPVGDIEAQRHYFSQGYTVAAMDKTENMLILEKRA